MCNIFSKTSKTDKEQIAELKSNYEELLNYVRCLKLSDLQDVSGCLQPNLGDVLTYTGRIWNAVKPASGEGAEKTVVTITPRYLEGNKIATITVDEEETDIYIPESTPSQQEIITLTQNEFHALSTKLPNQVYHITEYVPVLDEDFQETLKSSGGIQDFYLTQQIADKKFKGYSGQYEICYNDLTKRIYEIKDSKNNIVDYDYTRILRNNKTISLNTCENNIVKGCIGIRFTNSNNNILQGCQNVKLQSSNNNNLTQVLSTTFTSCNNNTIGSNDRFITCLELTRLNFYGEQVYVLNSLNQSNEVTVTVGGNINNPYYGVSQIPVEITLKEPDTGTTLAEYDGIIPINNTGDFYEEIPLSLNLYGGLAPASLDLALKLTSLELNSYNTASIFRITKTISI